jgi:hypothetical protein
VGQAVHDIRGNFGAGMAEHYHDENELRLKPEIPQSAPDVFNARVGLDSIVAGIILVQLIGMTFMIAISEHESCPLIRARQFFLVDLRPTDPAAPMTMNGRFSWRHIVERSGGNDDALTVA